MIADLIARWQVAWSFACWLLGFWATGRAC